MPLGKDCIASMKKCRICVVIGILILGILTTFRIKQFSSVHTKVSAQGNSSEILPSQRAGTETKSSKHVASEDFLVNGYDSLESNGGAVLEIPLESVRKLANAEDDNKGNYASSEITNSPRTQPELKHGHNEIKKQKNVKIEFDIASQLQELDEMPEDEEGRKKRLPDVIHIGERKTGTTALLHFLGTHPQVKAPSHEIHFFDLGRHYQYGLHWYVEKMVPSRKDEVSFEKSPHYFSHKYSPGRIRSVLPSVKLLLSVREPIRRAISDFHFTKNAPWPCGYDKNQYETFEEYVLDTPDHSLNTTFPPLARSVYVHSMRHWLQHFGRNRFYIFDTDAIVTKNPATELAKLEKFMGLRPYFKPKMFFFNEEKKLWCLQDPGCISFGGTPHPEVDKNVIQLLRKFFKPYNQQFFDLIGKEFPW